MAPTSLSAPQGLVEIGHRGALRAQRFVARDFGGKQVAFGVDHVELARHAVVVAQAREPERRGERGRALLLGLEAFARARLRSERAAHLAERVLDRTLV